MKPQIAAWDIVLRMQARPRLTAVLDVAARWMALGGGIGLLAIMAVTTVNAGAFIADRAVRVVGLNVAALPGYEDFVTLAISCCALMFLPWCQAERGHVTVDLGLASWAPRLARWLDRIALGVTAGLGGFLAYWLTLGMIETRADNSLSPVLGWPTW
ncbi:MAG: TRAP transporter small permease subunit, partial [Pseudomonadota bacterium]